MLQKKSYLLIFILIIQEILADITYNRPINIGGTGNNGSFYSVDAHFNNIAILQKVGNYKFAYWYQNDAYSDIKIPANINAPAYQIRTSSFNQNINISHYLIFSNQNLTRFSSAFQSHLLLYTTAVGENILDCAFGSKEQQAFLLLSCTMNSSYILNRYENSSLTHQVVMPINTSFPLAKMLYSNGVLLLHFQTLVLGYQISPTNGTMIMKYSHQYAISTTNLSNVSMDADQQGQHFCYTTFTDLYMVTLSNFSVTTLNFVSNFSLNSNTKVLNAKLVLKKYIIFYSSNKIYQYDYQLNIMIHQLTVSANYDAFTYNINQTDVRIVLHPKYPTFYKTMYEYNIIAGYFCSGGSNPGGTGPCSLCLGTYFMHPNDSSCTIIDYSAVSIDNSQTNSESKGSIADFLNSTTANDFSIALGEMLSFSCIRVSPKFLFALVCLLDDLEYYQYHRTNYPLSMRLAYEKVDLTNEVKFDSWVSNMIRNISNMLSDKGYVEENEETYKLLNFSGNDPSDVYFFYSTQEFFKLNILRSLLLFCVFKLLQFLFYQIQKKFNIFRSLYFTIKYETRWWTLIVALLEVNILKLSFSCIMQIFVSSSLNFEGKVSLACAVGLFLSLLIYSFCFYPLLFLYQKSQSANSVLVRSKYQMGSFIFEPCYLTMRNCLRAIIHSLLIRHYEIQIIVLFVSDLPFIPLAIKMRHCFINKFTFVLSLGYSIFFAIFDGYFALEEINRQNIEGFTSFPSVDREIFAFSIICILVGLTILICLGLLVRSIIILVRAIIKRFKKSNIKPLNSKTPKINDRNNVQKLKDKNQSYNDSITKETNADLTKNFTFKNPNKIGNLKRNTVDKKNRLIVMKYSPNSGQLYS